MGNKLPETAQMRVKRRERLLCNDRGRCSRESLSFPGNDWAHLAAQGNNLLIAIGRGGQFLTRSHRTALTEQTGPVPRVIAISFSSKTPYTVLVSGSAAPEVTAMITVLLMWESSAKLPWYEQRGSNPHPGLERAKSLTN